MTYLIKTVGLCLLLSGLLNSCQTDSYQNQTSQQNTADSPKKVFVDSNGTSPDTSKLPIRPIAKQAVFDLQIEVVVEGHHAVLQLFDGQRQEAVELAHDEIPSGVSKNQQFFSLRSYKGTRSIDPDSFEVEIRSVRNEPIIRQKVKATGFEGDDQFIPLEDGNGFIQATFTSTGLLNIYERKTKNQPFELVTTIDRQDYNGSDFAFDEQEKVLFLTYYDHNNKTSFVEKLDWKGRSIWRKTFEQTVIKKHLALAPSNEYLSFVTKKEDGQKSLYILDKKGEVKFKEPVNRVGNYYSSFQEAEGQLYLMAPSGAEHFYIVDLNTYKWLNNQKTLGKDIRVNSLSISKGKIYGTAYNRKKVNLKDGGFTLAPDQTFLLSGQPSGPFSLREIKLKGLPELVTSNNNWVIKESYDGQTQYYQF